MGYKTGNEQWGKGGRQTHITSGSGPPEHPGADTQLQKLPIFPMPFTGCIQSTGRSNRCPSHISSVHSLHPLRGPKSPLASYSLLTNLLASNSYSSRKKMTYSKYKSDKLTLPALHTLKTSYHSCHRIKDWCLPSCLIPSSALQTNEHSFSLRALALAPASVGNAPGQILLTLKWQVKCHFLMGDFSNTLLEESTSSSYSLTCSYQLFIFCWTSVKQRNCIIVSPLHMNKLHSKSSFLSPVCS